MSDDLQFQVHLIATEPTDFAHENCTRISRYLWFFEGTLEVFGDEEDEHGSLVQPYTEISEGVVGSLGGLGVMALVEILHERFPDVPLEAIDNAMRIAGYEDDVFRAAMGIWNFDGTLDRR